MFLLHDADTVGKAEMNSRKTFFGRPATGKLKRTDAPGAHDDGGFLRCRLCQVSPNKLDFSDFPLDPL